MSATLHAMSVPVFLKTLDNLSAILQKAADHVQNRKLDPAALLTARLFPDMFTLTRQVQLASDFAKGATARLAGIEPPKFEDTETTFEALTERIAKTRAFVSGVGSDRFEGAAERTIELKMRDRTLTMAGLPYLAHYAMPNFFFHVTTAYDILRHNGVELGKRDFIGAV